MAARKVLPTTPVVTFLGDPVASGLAASLARPGGTVTGLTNTAGPELAGKQLELLKSAVPHMSRVAILVNAATSGPAQRETLQAVERAARTLAVKGQVVELRGPGDFDGAFAALMSSRQDAIFAFRDAMFFQHRSRLAELAARSRLPAMWGLREHVEAGGLMAYSASPRDLARRAASYVDKILKGAKPADLPIEQPTKFDFVINLKAAKALGLEIPQPVLLRTDQVIQ